MAVVPLIKMPVWCLAFKQNWEVKQGGKASEENGHPHLEALIISAVFLLNIFYSIPIKDKIISYVRNSFYSWVREGEIWVFHVFDVLIW